MISEPACFRAWSGFRELCEHGERKEFRLEVMGACLAVGRKKGRMTKADAVTIEGILTRTRRCHAGSPASTRGT